MIRKRYKERHMNLSFQLQDKDKVQCVSTGVGRLLDLLDREAFARESDGIFTWMLKSPMSRALSE